MTGLCHAVSIRDRLKKLLVRFKVKLVSCDGKSPLLSKVRVVLTCSPPDDPVPVQKAIVSGFFSNAARLHYTGSYR